MRVEFAGYRNVILDDGARLVQILVAVYPKPLACRSHRGKVTVLLSHRLYRREIGA